MIDTDVAIHMRDRNPEIFAKLATLPSRPRLSILSLVELESGVYADPTHFAARRKSLDLMLDRLAIVPFDRQIVREYGQIVSSLGFSRRRVIDRLIAATAIVHNLTLATINATDFRDIPGLSLQAWPSPAPQ